MFKYNPYYTRSYKNGRPTFYHLGKGDKNSEIRAAGALFYSFKNNNLNLLMIRKTNDKIYEDFGGKTDMEDMTILDTISREVFEESNKIFKKEFVMKKLLNKNSIKIYNNKSKYLLFLIRLNFNINPSKFGNVEFHDNIKRTVKWINYQKYENLKLNNKINPRLYFNLLDENLNMIIYLHNKRNLNNTMKKLKI